MRERLAPATAGKMPALLNKTPTRGSRRSSLVVMRLLYFGFSSLRGFADGDGFAYLADLEACEAAD